MTEELYDEGHLRKYLLGELNEAEQQRLEERLLSEDELFDLLLVAEDELIDDCVGGALSAQELQRFDSFISTPERHRKLSFAMALRRYVRAEAAASEPATTDAVSAALIHRSPVVGRRSAWWKQAFSSPYLRLAAAAVIVISLGLGIWRTFFYQSEVAKGMAALARAYSAERPVEARISGLGYAPIANTRGSERTKVDEISLNRAERILLDEVAEHPSPAAHHALGLVYVANKEYKAAIGQLEDALKGTPNNAQLRSDLGAALLEKGKADRLSDAPGESFEEFAKSLEHLNKAVELDGSRLEALFNSALLYEYMNLPQQAEDDWKKYLEKDPNSKWADEARRHLNDLEERKKARSQSGGELNSEFVGAYQSRNDAKAYDLLSKNTEAITGQLVWWQLAGAYLDDSSKGESDKASQYWRPLAYAGELQETRSGDRFISEMARYYRSCSLEQKVALARAHSMINEAHALLARSETDKALDPYKKAKDIFDKTGDKWESQFAVYWIGYCYYRKSEFNEGLLELNQVAQHSRKRSYLWLLEQALTMVANLQDESNQFSRSIAYYSQSLEISKRINDVYNIQKNLSSLAYAYRNLGDRQESLAYVQRCLESASACWAGARQMYRNYYAAAGVLNSFGYYAAAGEYEKAALQLALEEADPVLENQSYVALGAIYAKLRDDAQALKYAELSYQAARMVDKSTSLRPIADSSLELGHIYRQMGDYDKAITYYDDAIRLYKDMNLVAFLYEAHKGRLLGYIAQDNDSQAKDELQTVLALFEEHRSKIREEKNKNSFFDMEQNVYDTAIDFEYSRIHDFQRAFEHSEVSRARSLLDLMTAGAEVTGNENPDVVISSVSQPLMLNAIRESMPEQAQILQYAVLEDKLLIWLISKTQFEVREEKISLGSLTDNVLNYYRSVASLSANETEESRSNAVELYKVLIKPVESLLEKDKQICIVPDKVLNCLPFNALISPATGKYLINDYRLSFAPSSNIFLACSDAARARSGRRDERLLSVGDPHFSPDAFPGLPELSSSGREAERIADFYKSPCRLIGEDARKERIRSEMERADVIHFASHYVVDENNPMLSKLLLTKGASKDDSSDGVLRAYEVCNRKLPVTRLVALSACRTGVERYYSGEGMIGMSRTFLAAGVPLVAASLWPVASDPTADLMIAFHRYRERAGLSTAEALRRAQLDMLNDPQHLYDRPYYWASFILIGGYASF
jgi:CHAT domain-containing protein/tetratricopeptide (TPR) repeat protein